MSDAPHTAIGSWSGYVYQGLCAAYHVLYLYFKEGDNVKDFHLSLDSYEDFSIFDGNGMIKSLHQCKCFADLVHDFTDEFDKMYSKRDTYIKEGKCHNDVKLYFHTNTKSGIDNAHKDIVKYILHDNADRVNPKELFDKIGALIQEINTRKQSPVNAELLEARLSKWIDQNVFAIHQKYIDSPKHSLKEYAAAEKIPFSDVINLLTGDGYSDTFTYEEAASRVRLYYCSYLQERKLHAEKHNKKINEDSIDAFIDALMGFPLSDLKELLIRLNPDLKIKSPNDLLNKTCGNNPSSLFNVIKFFEKVTSDKLHWQIDGKQETPSTLDSSKDLDEHCENIWKNRKNLNVLYDYDWIVGDVSSTTKSICETLEEITDLDSQDDIVQEDNIFSPRDTGILSINDRKNGNYN